jgi:CheY-like chemotaxis protein
MGQRYAKILFIEDELSLLQEFSRVLERHGHRVISTSHPDEALRIIRAEPQIDVVISDIQLPMQDCKEIGLHEAAGGRFAGLVLATELRRRFKRAPIVFWTKSYDREVRQRALALGNVRLIAKSSGAEPVLDFISDVLDGYSAGTRPRSLLVHGHDVHTLREVKSFLQRDLRFPEPIVLRDTPNVGTTIIEKIENHTLNIDLVFVLLTPDDTVVSGDATRSEYRARQNVIFEMGYFLGVMGRQSGRVLMLYRSPVDLPTDISGMVVIDITRGVAEARQELLQELREWT